MYKPTIGLEIHAELKTNSKMFCSCKNDPNEKRANFNICEICTAQPGTLPVANVEAVKKVIKAGLALNCTIAGESKFDRKNYFYPDIPKGYQISQYDQPLCAKGYLEISDVKLTTVNLKKVKRIGITRIHLEEDTGSSIHPDGADYSLVNFNRAGVPLMELVTEPDITSGQQAADFAKELQLIFKYLGVSDADMEKGLMRVEVNISVSKNRKFGTKVEIKNLNSFRVVQKAIDFEILRQTELLENGGVVVQETRGWNDKKEITFSQREKESAHDYRYFPEPDLPPMHFSDDYIAGVKSEIPELPEQKRKRFTKEFGLEEKSIEVFINKKDLSEYFEKVISELDEWMGVEKMKPDKNLYKLAANYLSTDLVGLIRDLSGKDADYLFSGLEVNIKASPENFAEFVKMIYRGEITSKVAKVVLIEMIKTGIDPSDIVEKNNWGQMKDDVGLEKIIQEVIAKNPKAVADYKAGNQNAIQSVVGMVMKETRGTANPTTVQEILKKLLK